MNFIESNQDTIRLSVFLGVFLLMAFWELLAPRKKRALPRLHRWFTNWALVVVDSIALRLVVPILAVAMAEYASQRNWGLFNVVEVTHWIEIILAIIVLDMLIYAQHVASHKFPILWRFHKVHHADRDIDVTTGARFHPIEILLSMAFKLLCVVALGAPALAVFLFEVILNASAMFNHSNVRLHVGLDKLIRVLIVTPDMHRVHHSIVVKETDSNYGFFLSVWDRLYHTYTAQPRAGHDDMIIGLAECQDQRPTSLFWSLQMPFINIASRVSAKKKSDELAG